MVATDGVWSHASRSHGLVRSLSTARTLEAHLDRDRAKKCLYAEAAGANHEIGIRSLARSTHQIQKLEKRQPIFVKYCLCFRVTSQKHSFMWSRASLSEHKKEGMAFGEHVGAIWRRRKRRLRQWHRHERLAISMASSGTKHHTLSRSTFLRQGYRIRRRQRSTTPYGDGRLRRNRSSTSTCRGSLSGMISSSASGSVNVPVLQATGDVAGKDALMLGQNVELPVAQMQEQTSELDKQHCIQQRGVKETVVLLVPQLQEQTTDEEDCRAAR